MATNIFKKETNGFSINQNGTLQGFAGVSARLKVKGNSITIFIDGQPLFEVLLTDTNTINTITYDGNTGNVNELAGKIQNEVFPNANTGTGGSGSLNDVPDGSDRHAMTTAQRDYINSIMGVNNTDNI